MTIYCTHGIAADATRALFQFRNLEKAHAFEAYLKSLPHSYTSIECAMAGKGDALTIDDSTRAAFDAALIARAHGHEVTVFVNGYHIEHQEPYSFVILNLLLDTVSKEQLVWSGEMLDVKTREAKKKARKIVKAAMLRLNDERDQISMLREIGSRNGVVLPAVPKHLFPLSKREVTELIESGVSIENHGWSHRHPGALDSDEYGADVMRGARWLADEFGIRSRFFAAPFGDALPVSNSLPPPHEVWMTLHDVLLPGQVGPVVYNRVALRIPQ